MRISETDLNVLAQVFYENKGPEVVVRRSMTAKEDITAGLRAVFETLGFEVVEGDRLALEVRVPNIRIVSRLDEQFFDVEDYRGDLERRIAALDGLADKYEKIHTANPDDHHALMSEIRVRSKAMGVYLALGLLPPKDRS